MIKSLFFLDPHSGLSLQTQIRQHLVGAILKGAFPRGSRLPSSRKLAEQLEVARNTVVLAYEQLIEEGYLESRQRSGVFVNEHIRENRIGLQASPRPDAAQDALWSGRIRIALEGKPQFQWPAKSIGSIKAILPELRMYRNACFINIGPGFARTVTPFAC